VLSALAVGGVGVASASAAEPYGEVTRFGGYEAKASAPDRFSMPAGFAVDPESELAKTPDGNAVFVLDLVENDIEVKAGPGAGKGTLRYKLHELSSTGEELGHAEVAESYTDTEHFTDAHPLISLAVDPKSKRVYATVESIVRESHFTNGTEEWEPVIDELVAWDTEPTAQGQLVAPVGLTGDPVTKSAGLVAGSSELLGSEAAKDLYAPQGLVVANGVHNAGDVVIEAQNGVVGKEGGATVLKEVATEGADAGKVVALWEASTTLAPNHEPGGALFAATDGSGGLGVGFYKSESGVTTFITPLAGVSEDMSGAARIFEDTSGGQDVDQAAATGLNDTPNVGGDTAEGRRLADEVYEPSGSVTQLIGGEHLYAALYGHTDVFGIDPQAVGAQPWHTAGATPLAFWVRGGNEGEFWGNLGIRLVNAAGRVIDTIGGGEPKAAPTAGAAALLGSCDIDYGRAGIAAGAKESVFVLTSTKVVENKYGDVLSVSGDEVVEFAPGGHYQCPAVTGNVEVDGIEAKPENGEPVAKVAVQEGLPVKFDAISLDRSIAWNPPVLLAESPFVWGGPGASLGGARPREWQPFAFEWSFGEEPDGGPNHDGYTVVNEMGPGDSYQWPAPEAEHTYEKQGVYEAKVRVYGDYGTSVFPVEVHVRGSNPPVAKFMCTAEITAGEAVSCDAGESTPTEGTEIENYHWAFIEKGTDVEEGHKDSSKPTLEHVFGKAGEYEVRLTVRDAEGAVKEVNAAPQTVTVKAAPEPQPQPQPNPGNNNEPQPVNPPVTTPVTTPLTTTPLVKPVGKPLTAAQKLASALKACKKLKSKKQRASCEKQAKKKFASKPKKATKKGRKK
jgi:PKD repeat protein